MPAPVSPITNDYQSGKGRIYVEVNNSGRLEEIGDVDDFTISQENEKLERFSNQYGTKTKTDSRLFQQNATISMTAKMMTARNMAIAFSSKKNFMTQALLTGQTKTITGPVIGDIVELGKLDVTVNSVLFGPITGVLDTDFGVDTRAGIVKVLALPTAVGDAVINWDAAAIVTGDKRLKLGGGSSPDLECRVIYVALNANNEPTEKVTIHRVKLSPNGDINFISDDYREIPMTGEVIADTTKATGFQLYQLEDLTARTNTGAADA